MGMQLGATTLRRAGLKTGRKFARRIAESDKISCCHTMTGAKMGASTDQKWSAARTRKMTRLADQGMSAGKIADALGLTRNQVLGKMHRLGLKTKNPPPHEGPKWLNTPVVEKMTKLAGQRLSASQIGKMLRLTPGQTRY